MSPFYQSLHPIRVDELDPDAVRVVRRLTSCGFEAYLVGGCVRDLLLGRKPKDFDVATDATPTEVRATFSNCRIIGRRFRLAHVVFGRKIIETATFRAVPVLPAPDDGETDALVWRDNQYGTAEEDARRRDFTINGLFYDITSGKVIDCVGGIDDLRAGLVRVIGDPDTRFMEDPVRIIRAAKFAGRLGFSIEPHSEAAMIRHAGLIARCSSARVLEEIYRLLRSGWVNAAFRRLHAVGALAVLFPEIARGLAPAHPNPSAADALPSNDGVGLTGGQAIGHTSDQIWLHLAALDENVTSEPAAALGVITEPVSMAVLFAPLLGAALDPNTRMDVALAEIDKVVRQVSERFPISRKHRQQLLRILAAQRRLASRKPRKGLTSTEYFADALALLEVRARADGRHDDAARHWRKLAPPLDQSAKPAKRKPRRNRRRGRPQRDNAAEPTTE